jgi:hypothetical protein
MSQLGKAGLYRERAQRMRNVAERQRDRRLRDKLLAVALEYEALAEKPGATRQSDVRGHEP